MAVVLGLAFGKIIVPAVFVVFVVFVEVPKKLVPGTSRPA